MTPLHDFGDLIRGLLMLIPMSAVRVLFIGTLVVILVWVWRLPKAEVTPDGGARRWDEDLRIGATAALALQILAYALF